MTKTRIAMVILLSMMLAAILATPVQAAPLPQEEEPDALMEKGWQLLNAGKYEAALEAFECARQLYQDTGDRVGEGRAWGDMGIIYLYLGNTEQALAHYEQAKTILQEVGDQVGLSSVLNNIGNVYLQLRDYEQALTYYEQSLAIDQELGRQGGEGRTLSNIGIVYMGQGKYEQALVYLERALALLRESGDRWGEEHTLGAMGIAYKKLLKYELALAYYEEALTIAQNIGDIQGEGSVLGNIGIIYQDLGEYELALTYYEEALAIAKELGIPMSEADVLSSLGSTYRELGNYDQAKGYYEEALDIYQEIGIRDSEGVILNNIGNIYLDLKEYEQALTYYEQALAIAREVNDPDREATALKNIGDTFKKLNQIKLAIDYFQQTVEVVESMQAAIVVEELQSSFAERHALVYESLIDLLWEDRQYKAAYEYTERARSRAFLDQLAGGSIDIRAGADADLLSEERALLSQLKATRSELNALYNQPADKRNQEAITATEEQLVGIEANYAALLTRIRLQSPQVASLVSVDVASLEGVQELLEEDTTLVAYFVTDERTLAFIITRDSFETLATDVTREELTDTIESSHSFASLTDPYPTSLQQLHTWLAEPLLPYLTTANLIIVPHNVLHYVPFAALTDGEHYLVDNYVLSVLPSASALRFQHPHRDTDGTALLLGNPEIEASLPPLPYARQEAEAIAALYGTEALLGEMATEAAVWEQGATAGIIHLAAHAEFNEYNPLFSAILLAEGDGYDGRLEVHEIYGLDLSQVTNLVVLSACETQVGEISTGDEVVGLTRAFLYAGAPTVVASLWWVDDEATARLMTRFYEHQQSGLGPAEALREAQANIRVDYPHPYYWAGFTLVGNPGIGGGDVTSGTIPDVDKAQAMPDEAPLGDGQTGGRLSCCCPAAMLTLAMVALSVGFKCWA